VYELSLALSQKDRVCQSPYRERYPFLSMPWQKTLVEYYKLG
jgi:hypothetical protein